MNPRTGGRARSDSTGPIRFGRSACETGGGSAGRSYRRPYAPATWQTLSFSDPKGAKTFTPAAVMFDAQGQVWIADPITHQVQAASVSETAGASRRRPAGT